MLSRSGPLFFVILVAHVAVGVIGYGANAVAGWYAKRVVDGERSEYLLRFFDGTIGGAQWAIVGVPIVGVFLLWARDWHDASAGWFIIAASCWVVTAIVLITVAWPRQRRLGKALIAGTSDTSALNIDASTVLKVQEVVVVLYVVALFFMIVRPK